MTLREFIQNTQGKIIALPNGRQKGECVSLVQQYLLQVYNIPFKARGHAKDFGENLVKEGLATKVTTPVYGDIIVFSIGEYGHIGTYIDSKTMYDQNNGTHDNFKAGYSKIFNISKKYYRIKAKNLSVGNYKLLYEKYVRKSPKVARNKFKVKELKLNGEGWTKDELNMLVSQKDNDYGKFKKGVVLQIVKLIKEGNNTWGKYGKYGNDWVCLDDKTGMQAQYLGE